MSFTLFKRMGGIFGMGKPINGATARKKVVAQFVGTSSLWFITGQVYVLVILEIRPTFANSTSKDFIQVVAPGGLCCHYSNYENFNKNWNVISCEDLSDDMYISN